MATAKSRPLSPHLSVWRWGPHMLVSILHRVTGGALAVVGLPIFTWWLMAIADGQKGYDQFTAISSHPLGIVVLIGLTWAFFQKTFAGIRHLVMDTGWGFELDTNKRFAILTVVASIVLTALVWAAILGDLL